MANQLVCALGVVSLRNSVVCDQEEKVMSTVINLNLTSMGKIKTLNGIRFIMLLTIIVSHFEFLGNLDGTSIYDYCFHNPYMGVNYFFMLSGFGLTFAFFKRGSFSIEHLNLFNAARFAMKKVAKSIPIYAITMLVMAPNQLLATISGGVSAKGVINFFLKILLCGGMVQSATGYSGISHAFNGVCWFFSTLFMLYFAYPFLERFMHHIFKNKRLHRNQRTMCKMFFVMNLIFLIIVEYTLGFIGNHSMLDSLYDTPYFRIWHFTIGMLICYLFKCRMDEYEKLKVKNYGQYTLVEIFLVIAFILYWITRNVPLLQHMIIWKITTSFIDAVLPTVILYVFAFQGGLISKLLCTNIFQKLGGSSMYFYFIHYPVRIYVDKLSYIVGLSNLEKIFVIIVLTLLFTWMIRTIFGLARSRKV